MIGIIWNCRGLSKKGMSTCIEDLILDHQADFIGLQETTKKNYSENFFRKVDPLKSFVWHWLPAKGRSGGLLCGVKTERFEVREFSIVANVIDKKLKKIDSGHSLWPCTC